MSPLPVNERLTSLQQVLDCPGDGLLNHAFQDWYYRIARFYPESCQEVVEWWQLWTYQGIAMQLYFFRHAQAEDAQMPDFDDFARQLTDKGIQRTKLAATALLNMGIEPARLYSSPRLRARQTADILAKAFKVEVLVREEVGFSFSNQEVENLIADLDNAHSVVFIGHEPSLSSTISMLIGGGELVMKKGGVARVDIFSRNPLKGTLVWLMSPKVLDQLGEE